MLAGLNGKIAGLDNHAHRAQAGAETALRNRIEHSGILRGFGLKVGKTTPRLFEGRIRGLVVGRQALEKIADALLSVRNALWLEFKGFETGLLAIARSEKLCGQARSYRHELA